MVVNPEHLNLLKTLATVAVLPTGEEAFLPGLLLGMAGLGAPAASPGTVSAIAAAIDRMEGPGAKNNNPGNLRSWGNLPTSGGFAVFPSLADGQAALEQQVRLNIGRGLTLEEFFCGGRGYAGYAPDADRNNCRQYAANVSAWTGVPLGMPIANAQAGAVAPVAGGSPLDPYAGAPIDYGDGTVDYGDGGGGPGDPGVLIGSTGTTELGQNGVYLLLGLGLLLAVAARS